MILPQHTQHALLPVSAAELVPNDWIPVEAGLNVDLPQRVLRSANDGDLIHNGSLASLVLGGLGRVCKAVQELELLVLSPMTRFVLRQVLMLTFCSWGVPLMLA